MENKVSEEIAEKDFTDWLSRNHIPHKRRELYKDHADIIKESIMSGDLVFNDDATFTLKLNSSIGSNTSPIGELKFNARVNRKMAMPHLSGVKADDADGRIIAYMAAATGIRSKLLLQELMPEDQRIADSIVVFFIS